jgi:hypothetical protein
MQLKPEQIVAVTAVCRPPDLNGLLSFTIPLVAGGEGSKAEVKDDCMWLKLTDKMADRIEQLLKIRRERGI